MAALGPENADRAANDSDDARAHAAEPTEPTRAHATESREHSGARARERGGRAGAHAEGSVRGEPSRPPGRSATTATTPTTPTNPRTREQADARWEARWVVADDLEAAARGEWPDPPPAISGARAAGALVSSAEAAAVMVEPARARLLAELTTPASATELARRLGMPRQRTNYHLRELERVGAVELAEERRRGNCTERIIRRTAAAYLIDPAIMGPICADACEQRSRFGWAHLVRALGRAVADLASVRHRADADGKQVATLALEAEVRFASPEAMRAFAEMSTTMVAELAAKFHDDQAEHGRTYRFLLAGFPTVTEPA